MGDFFKAGDMDESGIIRGAARILFAEEGEPFKPLGDAEKVKINVVADNDLDKMSLAWEGGADPIKDLFKWQHKIEAAMKPSPEWESIVHDILAGKPRKINRWQMAVAYERGTPDPFNEKPPRGSLRDSLRWIKDCALYPWRIATGRLERPSKWIYVFHNLELVKPEPEIEFHFTAKDEASEQIRRMERTAMRYAMFRGCW